MKDVGDIRPNEIGDDEIPVTEEAEEPVSAVVSFVTAVIPALLFLAASYAVTLIGGQFGLADYLCRAIVRAAVIVVLIVSRRRKSPTDFAPFGCTPLQAVGAGGVGILMQIALAYLASLTLSDSGVTVGAALGPDDAMLTAFAVSVVLTPLCEEIIFRGIAFTRLCKCTGTRTAAVISSLLFALVHPSPVTAGAAFIAGLSLAFLFAQTKSLLVPVIAHASFNALSYFLGYAPALPFSARCAVSVAAIIGTAAVLIRMRKTKSNNEKEDIQ